MPIVIVNNEKYELRPPDTEQEFEDTVKNYAKEIFGENSEFFDIKKKLKSESGIVSIPDGYVIQFGDEASWYVVEIELSKHDLYDHIVKQISKFISGIKNPAERIKIINYMYEEIIRNRYNSIKEKIKSKEIHSFLTKLISQEPSLVIIIDEKTKELEEICDYVLSFETIVVAFKTFIKKDTQTNNKLHLIETLTEVTSPIPEKATEVTSPIPPKEVITQIARRKVTITYDQILKAAKDPRIKDFRYIEWAVEINGYFYPIKGLISLATGIPIHDFSTTQVRPILEKLGFKVIKIK